MAELASSVASNLVLKLGEYLFAPIGRQFRYVLCYNSYVQDLKNGVEKLENARERVQRSVDEAVYDGKPICNDIKKWLDSVKNKANEAQNLLKQGESAKTACFRGWLPNPMVRRPIGRKVKKMARVIQELYDDTTNNNFQKVYYENPPKGIVTATTSVARSVHKKEDVLESRASITEDVMKAITDEKICVVGVYGPGGVGKSKLLEDVERRVRKEKLFDVVAVANVSQNQDLKTIQVEIADALGLKLSKVEIARGRADRLRERLECDREKKILIILDNLWRKLELKDIGIPCGDDNKVRGCKLLLSSRNREILVIDMISDQEFRLKELDNGEARRLFERTVGDRVYDPEFKPLVDGVVKNCGGLPLCIISLAKRLRRGNLAAWRNALTIEGSDLKSLVELNYKDLKDERIQSLFLVCAPFHWIGEVDILVYCLGLGLFDNFSRTIQDARDRLNMDLICLCDSSLLLESDNSSERKIDSDQFVKVKMHDIVADVAISIASTEWKALVGREDCGFKKWSKAELRECTAMSFPWVGINELPEKLDCPNLRMFLLLEDNPSLKVPTTFFESMEKLQVLELNVRFVTSLPSSIEFLVNLKSLSLACCSLEDVTLLGKLKALQMLHLFGSTITRLPKEIAALTELRLLNLTSCARLKVIEPGVLRSLINLEELYMGDSFNQWEVENKAPQRNASLTELKNMNKLSTLDIAIPHSADLPRDLPFGKLNNHKIQIGGFGDWSDEYKESRTLKLKLDSGDLLFEEWVQRCLQRTQHLHLDGLQDGNDSIHDLCIEGFQELKYLHVRNSPSFHYVVHPTNNVQCTAFTRLVSLFLENLDNFKKICCGCLALESFSKLKIVKVDNCSEIKHLFPLSMTRILPQLEEIEISRCHLMQQIVADAEVDRDEIYDANVKLCNLHRLTLRNLPEMTSFYKTANLSVDFFDGQQLIKLQNLEAITIEKCQLIREVFDLKGLTSSGEVEILSRLRELTLLDLPSLESIWNKNPRRALCFRNLKALKVQKCENLRFLFSSSMAKALVQIKEIEIANCVLMEEIMYVQKEELEEATTTDTFEFPLLTSLSLEELPNLKTFSCGKYRIHCPSLTRLTITGCPKMMTFTSFEFEGRQHSMIVDTGLQQAFGCINSDLPLLGFFNEKVLFPSLEELKLSSMCQLKRIWHNQLHGPSFCKLSSLTVELCENLSHVFPSSSMDMLQSLNKIKVVGCPSLEALFEPISPNGEKRQKPFPSLMEVNVSGCHSLSYLFSSAMAKTLHELVVLDVSCCNNLRGIIAMEEGKGKTVETFKFPHLTKLKLDDLKSLMCFSPETCAGDGLHPLFDEKLAFPKLEELHVEGVQHKEIWNDKIHAESFCRLKVLEVKQCHNIMNVIPSSMWKRLLNCMEFLTVVNCRHLRNLFTMSMAKSLGQLQYLSLSGCGEMEHIVAEEEEKPEGAVGKIVFPQLVALHLHNMPKVRGFCEGKHISEWPSLEEFIVQDCKAVKVIFGDADCRKLEGSVQTHQPFLLVEKVLLPSLEKLKLSSMCQLKRIWHNQLQGQSFCKLASLTVEHCENLSHVFLSNSMDMLQNLNKIKVVGCPSLEALFEPVSLSVEKRQKPLALLALRELTLLNLSRLRDILKSDCKVTLAFPRLMEVKVRGCHSLPYLLSSATAKTLHELVVLDVSFCNNLQGIIAMEEGKEKTIETFKFPHLTKLKLDDLKSLICFSLESCVGDGLHPLFDEKLAFPKLEELHVEGVQQKEIWNDKIHVESFHLLKVLKVKQCHNLMDVIPSSMWKRLLHCMESLTVEKCQRLRNIFTMSMAKSLRQLQYLGLGSCGEIEYIVAKEEEKLEEATDKLIIPKLVTLYLHNMPKLRSFYQGKHISEWPSLKEFTVEDCKAVKVILGDVSCRKLEGSVPTHQPLLLVEKVEFPALESMKILHMENMDKIWLDDLNSNAFGKLKTLEVEHCEKLLSIFSSYNMLTRFQNLEKITVTNCGSLEVAFQVQEFEFSEACSTNSFQLGEIVFTQLPKMKHVWNGLPQGGLTFGRLQCMKVVKCESLNSLFPTSVAKNMTQLKELLVRDCGVEEIIAEKDGVGMSASNLFFPQLTDLRLLELPKLGSFYGNSHTSAWPLLKQLRVRHCGKMRSFLFACEFQGCQGTTTSENQSALFSFEKVISHLEGLTLTMEDVMMMMPQHHVFHHLKDVSLVCYHDENVAFPSNFLLHRFPILEELVVRCSSFEEIFPEDSSGHEGAISCGELTDMEKPLLALQNLRRLDLIKLCNLKRVWKDGSLMAEILKQIEVLWVVECPRLPIILPSPIPFQRLAYLAVKDCSGLVHMGTCSAATSLVHLTWLSLRNCGAMEDVVTDDGNGVEEISFPKLRQLELIDLLSLESFSPINCTFRFPSLLYIVVMKCPKMNIFCNGALRTPYLDKVLLSEQDGEWRWEGDLNTTIRTLST